jgi:hypothetical protein
MLAHWLGLDSPSSPFYLFWSGVGGVSVTLLAGLLVALRWFNCDERRCWRRGRYQVPDSLMVVCRPHWERGQLARDHDL